MGAVSPDVAAAPVSPAPSRFAAWRERLTYPVLVANLVAQIGIVVTGGAVRLTGSGLGCSTWPQCEPGQFTAAFHPETTYHQYVEFGNRTLTGVLGVIAVAVALLVWFDRDRSRSYRWLGFAPLAGVVAQALIGGVVVLLHLHPAWVSLHFMVSMALVAASTLLVHRSREGDGPRIPVVGPWSRRLAPVLGALLVLVLALGVITTGAGPHSGDEEVGYRIAVDPYLMARVHAASVWLFTGMLVVLLWLNRRGPRLLRRRGWVMVGLVALQGVIGYVQVSTDLPILLVMLHMLGAALLAAGTTRYLLTFRTRA
ncbi:COX15/CtaA family protein [Cellulomonas sp. PS-H5]|nr:COX15/CtaA family protein [Cellulomonas sp. PS-H5]